MTAYVYQLYNRADSLKRWRNRYQLTLAFVWSAALSLVVVSRYGQLPIFILWGCAVSYLAATITVYLRSVRKLLPQYVLVKTPSQLTLNRLTGGDETKIQFKPGIYPYTEGEGVLTLHGNNKDITIYTSDFYEVDLLYLMWKIVRLNKEQK